MLPAANAIEVNENNIQTILSQSVQLPVLLYFFAAQSPETAELAPVLAQLQHTYQDQFTLATLDCEQHPMLAAQFGLRALPTFYLLHQGQPVNALQGQQSLATLQDFLAPVLPAPEEILVNQAQQHLANTDYPAALTALKQAQQTNAQRSDITLLLAQTYLHLQRVDEAKQQLATIAVQDQDSTYQQLMSQIDLQQQAADTPAIQQLQQQVQANPDDALLANQLALQLHQVGRHQEALTLLFNHLRHDLQAADGQCRQLLLDIVAALGNGDPLANRFRRQLYALMY